MRPQPAHLGPRYGAQFGDASVVRAYASRPLSPARVAARLRALVPASPRAVLDLGCGPGDLAVALAPHVARVDAVDPSAGMIAWARARAGDAHPGLRFVCARAEEAALEPPYGLAVAANSLHWMEWRALFPRLRRLLAPGAPLAIVYEIIETPWRDAQLDLVVRLSTNRDFRPYDPLAEIESRGLLRRAGAERIAPRPFAQTVESYIESCHARNGLSLDRMTPEATGAFDAEMRRILAPHARDGRVHYGVGARIVWGEPLDPA